MTLERTALTSTTTPAQKAHAQSEIAKRVQMQEHLTNKFKAAQQELKDRKSIVLQTEQNALTSPASTPSSVDAMPVLIAAGITRFGVLAIAIYLVQILVGLYRYNAQVAAHYFAHADALLLLGEDHVAIGEMSSKLQLKVSFGKPETPILEQLTKQLGLLLKERGSTKSG